MACTVNILVVRHNQRLYFDRYEHMIMIECNFFLLQTVDRKGVSADPLIYNVQILPTWGNSRSWSS
jgi:hypothetical protein